MLEQGYRVVDVAFQCLPALDLSCECPLDQAGPTRTKDLFRPTGCSRLGGHRSAIERIEQPAERQDDKGLLPPLPQPDQPGGIVVRLFQPPQGNRAYRSSHLVSIDRVDQRPRVWSC